MANRATYFISFNSGSTYTEIFPSNDPKVKLTRETGEIFSRWRVDSFKLHKLKNPVVVGTIASWFFDTSKFGTDVLWQIKENGTLKYSFASPLICGKFNDETNVYTGKPEPDDAYRDILLQYEKKWHRGTGSPFTVDTDVNYPVLDTGNFSNVDFTTFTDASSTITYTNTTSAKRTATNPLAVTVQAGRVVLVQIKNLNVNEGDNPRIKLTDITGADKSNVEEITADGWYILEATGNADRVEIAQTDDNFNSEGSFDYEIYNCQYSKAYAGRPLKSAIDDILNDVTFMNLGLGDPVSTILWNDALETDKPASINTYFSANPTNDYVLQAAAIWNNLWIGRADAWTTEKTSDFQYSLKDLMDILKLKLRLWWFIDSDGKFRIEHEKYFRSYTAQADLTAVGYANQKIEVDRREYDFQLSDAVSQINYIENNSVNEDWVASPVLFDPLKTSKNARDVRVDVTTDIKSLIDNPDSAQGSGFTLMRCQTSGAGYYISLDESTKTAGTYIMNAKLGWYFICANYQEYFAEALTGTVNGAAHTFDHVKEYLKQEKMRCCPGLSSISWKKPFTLSHGAGQIEECEYTPDTGWATISVSFDPYA